MPSLRQQHSIEQNESHTLQKVIEFFESFGVTVSEPVIDEDGQAKISVILPDCVCGSTVMNDFIHLHFTVKQPCLEKRGR